MCSTRAVAESTNCPCRLTWSQAVAELKQEDPVTSWIILGLWRGIVYVVGLTLAGIALAATGLLMMLRWSIKALWVVMTTPRPATVEAPKVAIVTMPAVRSVAVVRTANLLPEPIAIVDWPTERHHILKVGDQNAKN